MILSGLKSIETAEKRTFWLHMVYSIIDGIILGIFTMNEFILIKSLKGTNYQIGFLVQFTVLVLTFSTIINVFFKRVKNKKNIIRYVGIITRLPLILFILFPVKISDTESIFIYQLLFLFIFLVYYMANPLLYPAINHLLKNSYSHGNFGRLYGYASTLNKIMMLLSTFLFGYLLDSDHAAYKYVYPMVSIFGIISIYILTGIKYQEIEYVEEKKSFFESVKSSFTDSMHILRNNKPYRDFENAFFFYGMAWMATAAVIPIFFETKLGLNYSSIALYKNWYNTISILILPFLGKLIGRIDPRKFAIYTFSAMLVHVFFLMMTEYFPVHIDLFGVKLYYSLVASYISYGLFGAMMALLWYIGSSYFCRNEEVSLYQSVHLSLTGIRGFLAPILGILLLQLIGFTGVYLLSMLSLSYAIYTMIYSMKKYNLNGLARERKSRIFSSAISKK